MTDRRLTRRELLATAAAAGMACAWMRHEADAQGFLANLAPEESVEATIKRLFAGRALRDGSAVMTLEAPLIAEDGGNVPLAVEVKSPMTPQSYVKAIYILSDKNPRPLNAKLTLTPACGQAYVATNIRLADTGDVRVVAEMQDGALLMVKRSIRVVVAGCAA
ncbi:MAG TPA: thiosulfate oxidation carrier protein SoxY [Methylomirabilota bacterium]|jgi:sulfur-oxidizing protein SoxY|nr:thiosulfate oxidation carrier protein SoxY [Methylomirabilota bacterium]